MRRCTDCNSLQVVERREIKHGSFVVVKHHCKMCRRDLIVWSGTRAEDAKRRAQERGSARRLASLARRLAP